MPKKKTTKKTVAKKRTTTRKANVASKQDPMSVCYNTCKPVATGGCTGYCIGFIGALVYYISTATSFWGGVWGVIKALVWPAFLVFELMKFLGM